MNMKNILTKSIALALGLALALSMVACGGDKKDNTTNSSSESKGENKVSKNNLETAESFLAEKRPESFSGSGFANALEEKWADDPLFSEIVAVSAISGLPTYQGSASDDFSVVKANIPNEWDDYKVDTAAYVALNKDGEIVLAWLDCGQDVSEESRLDSSAESASESDTDAEELPQANNIRTVVPLNSDLLMAGMRLNEVRAANNLPLIGFESMDGMPPVDTENAPAQNAESGDPNNMTEEEQQQYNETQEEIAASEEAAESDE